MAYACPVCAEPQIDAEHLANHLAFTAITGDDAHEEWLDSTVPEWGQLGEGDLAEVVVDHADETEFPVEVDAADIEAASHDHDHGHDHGAVDAAGPAGVAGAQGSLDEDAQDVIAEARELTQQMQGDADEPEEVAEGDDAVETDEETSAADSADADSSDNETQ